MFVSRITKNTFKNFYKNISIRSIKGKPCATTVENKTTPDSESTDEYEEMFVTTPFNNVEWGGPLRGGKLPEPTRFGDWERKGRCTDY